MTIRELYLANCDWTHNNVLKVLDGNTPRTLYEGNYFEMPIEIENLEVLTFKGCTIVTK